LTDAKRSEIIARDVDLAVNLLTDMFRPRVKENSNAIVIKFLPMSTQPILNDAASDTIEQLITATAENPIVSDADIRGLQPFLSFARKNSINLLAAAPEFEDVDLVRRNGLDALPKDRRKIYFPDVEGFQNQLSPPTATTTSAKTDVITLSPNDIYRKKFRMYADTVMTRRFVKANEDDKLSNFFGSRCLEAEAAGSVVGKFLANDSNSLAVVLDSIASVEYVTNMRSEATGHQLTRSEATRRKQNKNKNRRFAPQFLRSIRFLLLSNYCHVSSFLANSLH